jgi:hypothetical protein
MENKMAEKFRPLTDAERNWGSPEIQKMVKESHKAQEELMDSPGYIIRTARKYLEGMSCMVPNKYHRTYSDDGKLLCVTMPASLAFRMVEYMEKGEIEAERIEKMSWDDLVEYMQGRMN